MAAGNGTIAIWEKLKPLVGAEIAQQTRSCCQMVQMVVATPYDAQTQTVGVREAFAAAINIPVSGSVDTEKLTKGVSVWVALPFGSYSNAIVVMLGDGETGYAANAGMLGGKKPAYYLPARTLLVNGYFADPVNQRGASVYTTAGHDIDRWKHLNSNLTVEIVDGGVKLTNGTTTGLAWQQVFDGDLDGKTVTAALCEADGTITVGSGTVTAAPVEADTVVFIVRSDDEKYSVVFYKNAGGLYSYRIFVAAGETVTLRWAALYEGEYTAETLPPFQPRGYVTELAECRWYFRRHKYGDTYATVGNGMAYTSSQVWINVPRQPMRIAAPTVSTSSTTLGVYAGSAATNATGLAIAKISDDYLRFTANATGIANGAAIVATNGEDVDFYIDEDADL